jgi:4-amino-4-deoxy-L-arabinose transferase-like glycosyltransferase
LLEAVTRRARVRDLLAIGIPALLALALCLYDLTSRSLWLDESATVAIVAQHGGAFGAALARDGGNMLGYYALLHILTGLLGSGPFLIRVPSVVSAVATVAIVGVIAIRLGGRRTAWASGLLAAVSLSLVYWGQDARGYALMLALIAGSFLALMMLLEPDSGWTSWLAYVALTVAAVYAGLEAVLVVPAQLVVLFWFRERLRRLLSAVLVTAIACVPLAVLAAERGSAQLFWVPSPSLRIAKQIAEGLASSGLQPSFYTSTGTALLILTAVVALLGIARVASMLRGPRRALAWRPALMLAWLLVPAALALLESAFGHSIFQARYLLVSLPAVALLLGWTISDSHLPRPLSLALLAALIALRALQLAPAYGVSPENWRAATAYVIAHARAGDCAAFYPLDNRMPFEYYHPNAAGAPDPILPTLPWGRVRPFVEDYASLSPQQVARLPVRCRRVWLVSSHEGRGGGPPISRGNFTRLRQLIAGLRGEYTSSPSIGFGAPGLVTVTLFTGAA